MASRRCIQGLPVINVKILSTRENSVINFTKTILELLDDQEVDAVYNPVSFIRCLQLSLY